MPRARCQRSKDQGWLSLLSFLSFLSLSLLFCDFFWIVVFFMGGGGGGGRGLSLIQVLLLIILGPEKSLLRVHFLIPFGHYCNSHLFGPKGEFPLVVMLLQGALPVQCKGRGVHLH